MFFLIQVQFNTQCHCTDPVHEYCPSGTCTATLTESGDVIALSGGKSWAAPQQTCGASYSTAIPVLLLAIKALGMGRIG